MINMAILAGCHFMWTSSEILEVRGWLPVENSSGSHPGLDVEVEEVGGGHCSVYFDLTHYCILG